MGSKADLENRVSQVRVDNHVRRAKIAKARKLVYEKGASIKGTTVDSILELESMVPTVVSATHECWHFMCAYFFHAC
jgi:hypothetical protein